LRGLRRRSILARRVVNECERFLQAGNYDARYNIYGMFEVAGLGIGKSRKRHEVRLAMTSQWAAINDNQPLGSAFYDNSSSELPGRLVARVERQAAAIWRQPIQ